MRGSISIDFIGHSSLLIEVDGVRVLTDPAFRGRIGPLRRTVAPPRPLDHAGVDIALVSHLHWDHLDLPSLRALGPKTRLVVPRGAGPWVRRQGFELVDELSAAESLDVAGLTVEAVPAQHGGFRPPIGPSTEALGYVLRGTRSIYFAGDTDIHPAMARLEGIDVALLPVSGWGPSVSRGRHLDPARAARAVRMIGSPTAVPIHWGTYWPLGLGSVARTRLVEPPRAFERYAAELAPDALVLPTAIGERVALP